MISPKVTEPLLWRSASRFHDWTQGDLPRTLLTRWLRDGVIGVPRSIEANDIVKPFDRAEGARIVDRLLGLPKDSKGHLRISAEGADPHEWFLSIWIPPYDPEVGRNDGYAMINLMFARSAFNGPTPSKILSDAFESIYRPDNCEFACIHPEDHHGRLLMKPYETALTFGPMFAGMFWANFLGPGHVERFSRETIDALPVFRRRWFDDQGVCLIVSDDVATVDSIEGEKQLIAMTEQLRATSKR